MQDEASGLMMLSKKVTETTMCNLLNALLSSWVSFAEKQEEIEVLVMLSGQIVHHQLIPRVLDFPGDPLT